MTATVTCCEDKGTQHGTRIHKEDKVFFLTVIGIDFTDPMLANIGKPVSTTPYRRKKKTGGGRGVIVRLHV